MNTNEKSATSKSPALKLEQILVPIDFSPASEPALEYALALARQFEAKLTLIHVVEPVVSSVDPSSGYMPVDIRPLEDASAKQLEKIGAERVPTVSLETTLVRTGVPFQEITAAAKELKMDLIVITTHGYTGLAHVLLGSTAERIVRHAGCPVLTVRSR